MTQTCESGSMFQKLASDSGIYAVSAASPTESSWGCYCSPDDVIMGKHIGPCLGDLFSVNWIEDSDESNAKESLQDQYEIVKKKTNRSKVMQWGDLSFLQDPVDDFIGKSKKGNLATENIRLIRPLRAVGRKPASKSAHFNSRTNKLQSLSALYARERSHAVFQEMMEEMADMQRYDSSFNRLSVRLGLTGSYNDKDLQSECIKETFEKYEQKCGRFSDYGLKYVSNFAEAC